MTALCKSPYAYCKDFPEVSNTSGNLNDNDIALISSKKSISDNIRNAICAKFQYHDAFFESSQEAYAAIFDDTIRQFSRHGTNKIINDLVTYWFNKLYDEHLAKACCAEDQLRYAIYHEFYAYGFFIDNYNEACAVVFDKVAQKYVHLFGQTTSNIVIHWIKNIYAEYEYDYNCDYINGCVNFNRKWNINSTPYLYYNYA